MFKKLNIINQFFLSLILTGLFFSCKDGPSDLLQKSQWVVDSYTINGIEWIDSTDAFRQLRFTFYENGEVFRSSYAGTYQGDYYFDEENLKLLMLQEDTVQYQITLLNSIRLEMGGKRGVDSLFIEAYH